VLLQGVHRTFSLEGRGQGRLHARGGRLQRLIHLVTNCVPSLLPTIENLNSLVSYGTRQSLAVESEHIYPYLLIEINGFIAMIVHFDASPQNIDQCLRDYYFFDG
jgi:hypothetical protein